jgi:hypothetical protein
VATEQATEVVLWPFLETHDGGPSGFWGCSAESTGDSSGGHNRAEVQLAIKAQLGRVFVVRYASLLHGASSATTAELMIPTNYLNASTVRMFAGETVVGVYGSSLVVPYLPLLIIPAESPTTTALLLCDFDNVNGVKDTLFVQGHYWDLDHLTKSKARPRFFGLS